MKRAMKILSWTMVVLAVANAVLCGIDGEWWRGLDHINLMIAWLFVIHLQNQLDDTREELDQKEELLLAAYGIIKNLQSKVEKAREIINENKN